MGDKTPKQLERERRERLAIQHAQQTGRAFRYIDDDGCEVTVTPDGYAFYNMADWY